MAHSALGPSAAHRWGTCPGSVNAERLWKLEHPDAIDSSPWAEEGTRAHELAEHLLNNPHLPEPGDEIDTMQDVDMLRHCLRYRDYCQALLLPTSMMWVEERVTMPRVHKSCFGTGDFIAYEPVSMHLDVADLKYGSGLFVDVYENPQAMLYAEGARQMLHDRHRLKVRSITVHIFQPRAMQGENIAHYKFSNLRLDDFVSDMHYAACATEVDVDTFVPGDKQCRWCKANPCAARAKQMHELFADEFEDIDDGVEEAMGMTPFLTDDDVGAWLTRVEPLKAFVAKIEAMAYDRVMDGKTIPGHKLVQGRGSYQVDREALEFVLGEKAYREPELRSKTDIEKLLGARQFRTNVADLYRRSPGKPKLVPASDPRPAWNVQEDIDDLFDDL